MANSDPDEDSRVWRGKRMYGSGQVIRAQEKMADQPNAGSKDRIEVSSPTLNVSVDMCFRKCNNCLLNIRKVK